MRQTQAVLDAKRVAEMPAGWHPAALLARHWSVSGAAAGKLLARSQSRGWVTRKDAGVRPARGQAANLWRRVVSPDQVTVQARKAPEPTSAGRALDEIFATRLIGWRSHQELRREHPAAR